MSSIILNNVVLIPNTKYKVQETSKFPKNRTFLIGKEVLFLKVTGSTASVRHLGNLHEVPVRSLINVIGYTAKGVKASNADGFVVVQQNTLGINVGTVYLEPVAITNEHFVIEAEGKRLSIPLNIVSALVKNENADTTSIKKKEKISAVTGLDTSTIEHLDEMMAPSEIRKDIDKLPIVVEKLLPSTNFSVLKAHLREADGVFSDYEGNLHATISEADKANTLIRHKLLQAKLMILVSQKINNEFDKCRNEEI